jgi:hypothetical protein
MPPPPMQILAVGFDGSGNFLIDFKGTPSTTYARRQSPTSSK